MSNITTLTDDERSYIKSIIMGSMLSDSVKQILSKHLEVARVTPDDFEMSRTLTFDPSGVPQTTLPDGVVQIRPIVLDDNDNPIGEFVLWVKNGYLSDIEYTWYVGDMPKQWPTTSRVTFQD